MSSLTILALALSAVLFADCYVKPAVRWYRRERARLDLLRERHEARYRFLLDIRDHQAHEAFAWRQRFSKDYLDGLAQAIRDNPGRLQQLLDEPQPLADDLERRATTVVRRHLRAVS